MLKRRTFLASSAAAALGSAATPPKPNIIVILCDDLGYGDLGCYGSSIRTPNIDRLAADGMRFTNFDSADPVCSPSRAALLTGRYPTRVGVPRVLFPADKEGLALDETTLANVANAQGYKTTCIGKWHLGTTEKYLPTSRGFDHYLGIPYSNDMNPRSLLDDTKVVEEPATLETLTQRYSQRAVQFIRESAREPFFLYMPHTFPHIPLAASDRFRGKSAQGLYGEVVEELDWSVGQVLDEVKRNSLERNTLVLFTSDNGPWYQGSPGRLRGRKDTTYEGGVREPFIARWPGKIPVGKVSAAVTSMLDIFPTVSKRIGGTMPEKPLDGIDIWPILSSEKTTIEREALLYFDKWDLQCARWDRWKLHIARHNTEAYNPAPVGGRHSYILPQPELYNLEADPQESYDVAPQQPEVVAQIQARVEKLLAGFPEPVQKAFADAKARKVNPTMPAAARPVPIPQ